MGGVWRASRYSGVLGLRCLGSVAAILALSLPVKMDRGSFIESPGRSRAADGPAGQQKTRFAASVQMGWEAVVLVASAGEAAEQNSGRCVESAGASARKPALEARGPVLVSIAIQKAALVYGKF